MGEDTEHTSTWSPVNAQHHRPSWEGIAFHETRCATRRCPQPQPVSRPSAPSRGPSPGGKGEQPRPTHATHFCAWLPHTFQRSGVTKGWPRGLRPPRRKAPCQHGGLSLEKLHRETRPPHQGGGAFHKSSYIKRIHMFGFCFVFVTGANFE